MTAAWARYDDLASVSHAEARRIAEEVRAPWARGGPQVARITQQIVPAANGPVRVRFYDPAPDVTKPALIYLHGGGWTLFSIDTHDRVMREYAARALGQLAAREAVPVLRQAALDKDEKVRASAAEALKVLESPRLEK